VTIFDVIFPLVVGLLIGTALYSTAGYFGLFLAGAIATSGFLLSLAMGAYGARSRRRRRRQT
jgi:hypothetical protein